MAKTNTTAPRHFLITERDITDPWHPERVEIFWSPTEDGSGAMLLGAQVLDGETFQIYRDVFHSRIETDQPEKVCKALGLPVGERGIRLPRRGQGGAE